MNKMEAESRYDVDKMPTDYRQAPTSGLVTAEVGLIRPGKTQANV